MRQISFTISPLLQDVEFFPLHTALSLWVFQYIIRCQNHAEEGGAHPSSQPVNAILGSSSETPPISVQFQNTPIAPIAHVISRHIRKENAKDRRYCGMITKERFGSSSVQLIVEGNGCVLADGPGHTDLELIPSR